MLTLTEPEWLTCIDPDVMLHCLRGRISERKARLFAVACCRRIWTALIDQRSRRAVEVAERHADGSATDQEREAAAQAAWEASSLLDHFNVADAAGYACRGADSVLDAADPAAHEVAWAAASEEEQLSGGYLHNAAAVAAMEAERAAQCCLLRDLLGPQVYRPLAIHPAWAASNGGTVRKLAQAIYDDRRFGDLPILADALEEAGCNNVHILTHCRSGGDHVRGCWVVDLLLGRE
jgi:hypothetical protein